MKILSIFRKKSNNPDGVQDKGQEMLTREEEAQSISQEDSAESVVSLSDTNTTNKENEQTDKNETKEVLSIKNFNNMLSTKSELLKEGKEIVELINNEEAFPKRNESESDEEFSARKCQYHQQHRQLVDRYQDWIEYARLYIYKNQIIPTHYDEFMCSYNTHKLLDAWFIKKALRIIETCK